MTPPFSCAIYPQTSATGLHSFTACAVCPQISATDRHSFTASSTTSARTSPISSHSTSAPSLVMPKLCLSICLVRAAHQSFQRYEHTSGQVFEKLWNFSKTREKDHSHDACHFFILPFNFLASRYLKISKNCNLWKLSFLNQRHSLMEHAYLQGWIKNGTTGSIPI